MINIGIIGWRGLVGSVLINRIKSSFIIKFCELYLFSTNKILNNVFNAFDLNLLNYMNIIICCQGSNYTKKILKLLTLKNWKGYWIDSSSFLRMNKECLLILDPINKKKIKNKLKKIKIYSGANCTVSLLLLSLQKFYELDLIEWVQSTSYQAVSGAGSSLIKKIINEVSLSNNLSEKLLELEKQSNFIFKNKIPILFNAIPWIDKKSNFSQTKEEWKSQAEASKIFEKKIIIDSNCVRISSLRCHSQFFTIKLKKTLSLNSIYEILENNFIKIVKNNEKNTLKSLNPFNVCGKLNLFIGRIKKSIINKNIFNLFSIGDQLLWGAAEPLKRFLEIIIEELY